MTSIHHGFGESNLIRNKGIGNRQGDPLPRLLDLLLARAGLPATIERATSRPWASALFEGRRHVIRLRIDGPDYLGRCAAFTKDLDSVQWPLSGHFVADISLDEGHVGMDHACLDLSALTIEDW
ncbi:hypothetical protein Q4610_04040 [Sphingobium sp. HBC34]|uniref:Uncharacterized protein n=1 Tax=Sphingobium cyanobacteriorum TaxID=3063954 RepID=A0ABT8ZI46_9SPHN|nr:hypothetical protein [Sphingobium sp. HBC34]MDO7834209.1 hypothetical protein [Sphingobium sp. HBC34]